MDLSDEITLEEEEKNSVCVLFRDLMESLPCLCEVRKAIQTPVFFVSFLQREIVSVTDN